MNRRAAISLSAILLATGCGGGDYAAGPVPPPPPPLPVTVTVGPDDAVIMTGGTLQYQAVSTSTVAGWEWSVSDPAKATVSVNGLLLAVQPGNVQVRACASNAPGICGAAAAIVLGPPNTGGPVSITVTPGADTISVSQTVQFVASAMGFVTPGWTWAALDNAVATIDANGSLTGRRAGVSVVVACATSQPRFCGSAEVHVR